MIWYFVRKSTLSNSSFKKNKTNEIKLFEMIETENL